MGKLRNVVAGIAAVSAFSGGAFAASPDAPGLTVYANPTWSARLYVRPEGTSQRETDGPALPHSTTVGAGITGRVSRDARVTLEAFNVLGAAPREIDAFAGPRHLASPASAGSLPMLEGSRGIRLRLKATF